MTRCMMTMTACLAIAGAGLPAVAATDDTRPTVARREADLIARANALAETDLPAAIRLIADQDDGNLNAALDFTLGNLHVQRNDYESAAARFEQALDKFPAFLEARRNLGRVLLFGDRPGDAAAHFRVLALRPDAGAEDFLLLGHADFMADRPVTAGSAYRQALLRDPALDDAARGLVKALIRQSRYAEAAALCRELLERLPADAELWSLRANALLAADRTADTIIALETAERLGALDDRHRLLLADLYINAQQPADALRLYRLALHAEIPADAALRAARGFIMLGDTARAREVLDSPAIRDRQLEDTDRHELLRIRAEIALLDDNAVAAREYLQALLADDPLDGAALLLAGRVETALDAPEAAAMAYERAARITETRVAALRAHAQLEAGRSRYRDAARLLEAAQTLDPHPAVARYLEQVRRLERLHGDL